MKRLIAIMLCVISILSVLPVSVFAAEDNYAWAEASIEWSIKNNITSATSVSNFNPAKTLTRAEVVTFLYAYKGKPKNTVENNPFCDVSGSPYYRDAAIWAYKNGYVGGNVEADGKRYFMPNKICTYAEIVTMLYAVAGKPFVSTNPNKPYPYSNVTDEKYYYVPLKWCWDNMIMEYIPSSIFPQKGKFTPNASCTRAIFVTLLYKFYKVDTKAVEEMVKLAEYEWKYMSDYWNDGERYGRGGSQWCAAFVSWCAMKTGLADQTGVDFNPDGSAKWWITKDASPSYNYPVLRHDNAYYVALQFVYDNNKGNLFMSNFSYNYVLSSSYSFNQKTDKLFQDATIFDQSFVPRRGDIVFFRNHTHTGFAHVGIVTGCSEIVTKDGKKCAKITTVEGNSSDIVQQNTYTVQLVDGKITERNGRTNYVGPNDKWTFDYISGFGRIR